MTSAGDEKILVSSFRKVTGCAPTCITRLRSHASERRIYRLISRDLSIIGIINPSKSENDTFVSFAHHLTRKALPIPHIYLYIPEEHLYLEEDLGDETLFDVLAAERIRTGESFPAYAEELYKQSLEYLTRFQVECSKDFDFSLCHPERQLVPGSFTRDCSSFATNLVAKLLPSFDITRLAADFATLIAYLEVPQSSFLVHRDFQSRNIMIRENNPYFIDFQGGCKGPLQYDVVSLLYQSSTQLSPETRRNLLQHYSSVIKKLITLEASLFDSYYSGFIISRMLEVLGVYGRQGLGTGKEYFTKSIPIALTTLAQELVSPQLALKLPALRSCVERLLSITNAAQAIFFKNH